MIPALETLKCTIISSSNDVRDNNSVTALRTANGPVSDSVPTVSRYKTLQAAPWASISAASEATAALERVPVNPELRSDPECPLERVKSQSGIINLHDNARGVIEC